MKITVNKPVEIEVDSITLDVPIRYEDDREYYQDCYGYSDGQLVLTIDLETGRIKGYPKGQPREVHTKVCDEGTYTLNRNGLPMFIRQCYVPSFLPGQHYGDYIILHIDENGYVDGAPLAPDYDEFNGSRWEFLF